MLGVSLAVGQGRGGRRRPAALPLRSAATTRAAAGADDEHRQRRRARRRTASTSRSSWSCRSARRSFAEALRCGAEVYHALKRVLHERGLATGVGDEGGFAPDLPSNEEAIERHARRGRARGLHAGREIAIALDPAATRVLPGRRVPLRGEGRKIPARDGRRTGSSLVGRYPIVSIEDGMAEDDWDGWRALTERLGDTRPARRRRSLRHQRRPAAARASTRASPTRSSIKVNQIGTLTETLDSDRSWRARRATRRSSRTAPARPRTPRSPTSRSPRTAGQIKTGAPVAVATASRSTTSCCASRRSWATRAVYPGWDAFPRFRR